MTPLQKRMLRRRLALGAIVLAWLGAASFGLRSATGPQGVRKVAALRAEVARIQAENTALSAQLVELKRWIAAENDRPEVQAFRVRDLLGYVRPNECVVHMAP